TVTELSAVLEREALPVEAGESVACEIRIRNDGPEDVPVRLTVTGAGRPYSWLTPEALTVPAGSESMARVGFHLPRASVPPAGPLPFTVAVTAAGEDVPAAAAAGVLELRPFGALSAALAPTGDGKRQEVTVGNRGNAAVTAALRGEAEDDQLEIRLDPPTLTVPAGDKATARVELARRKRRLAGRPESVSFRVLAEPDIGAAVHVEGAFVAKPVVGARWLAAAAVLVAAATVAGLLVATSGDDGGASRPQDAAAAASAPLDPCPARGHTDAYGVRGLEPEEIDKLPNAYTFLRVKSDGCSPVRFNPCEPVHYIQNAAAARPEQVAAVHEAFRRLARATGIAFVDDGLTDETTRTGPYVPERYGRRWAPILILWEHFPAAQTTGVSQILGNANIMREGEVIVSGRLRFNVDAYGDEATRTPIKDGFGPPAGSGPGPIGRNEISWGRILMHELAHMVGLGHTRDKGSLMYPDAAQQTVRPTDFTPPDLLGLRYLGREAGCLTTPPVPAT
ncbi:MAG: M10 family metallopeptidase domain-containing protein, partial [Actinomycetota bacterium]|nr:M10 family metallopeptidase domain-containing protein [Actinomycetota bacterium]